MGIFKKISEYFKREIELNKQYYESLDETEDNAKVEMPESHMAETKKICTAPAQKAPLAGEAFSVAYSCGHIVEIDPKPQWGKNYYDILDRIRAVTFIVSDGKCYDLTDVDSIYSIYIATYSKPENDYYLSSYGTIEYLLQEKGYHYSKWTQRELGIACLRKAIELMKISDIEWDRQDYQRIVWRLKEFGAEEDAKQLEEWYKSNVLTDEQEAELILSGKLNKKLEYIHKEIITVKRVTTEDMLQFTAMPYQLNCPVKKYIEHGSHPFVYMDLNQFNQDVARRELNRLDEYIVQARRYIHLLTDDYHINVDKITFVDYSDRFGHTRLICTPYTFTGEISKYPLSLSFMSRGDIRTYSVTGELFYKSDGTVGKASVSIWKSPADYSRPGTGWIFEFGTFGSEFVLATAKTTLSPDKYGQPCVVYKCKQIIEEENARLLNRAIFEWIQKNLPEDCPKSISGFSRMRNANTKNYQALVKKAEAAGFVFPQTLDDVANWPENQ